MVFKASIIFIGGSYYAKFEGEYVGNDLVIIILAQHNKLGKWPLLMMETESDYKCFSESLECSRVIDSGNTINGVSQLKGAGLNIDSNGALYTIDNQAAVNSSSHIPFVARYIYPVTGKLTPTAYKYSSFQSSVRGSTGSYEVLTGGVLVIDLFHINIYHFTPDILRAMNLSRFELVDKYFK